MKKSLCWLYPHLEHDDGGTKFLFEAARRLTKYYFVTIVCNSGKHEVVEKFEKANITVKKTSFICADSNIYWFFLPILLFYDCTQVLKYVKNSDTVIATLFPSNAIAFIVCSILKIPYYFYCYEPFPYLHNRSFIAAQPFSKRIVLRIFSRLYAWLDITTVKHAKNVLTLNAITKALTKEVYGKDAIVTRMGVDTMHFRKFTNNPVSKQYKNRLLIIHSTDYSYFKHTDLAIKTIGHLVDRFPNILLLITSTQPHSPRKKIYLSLIKKLTLEKQVQFLDHISYDELPNYFSASICYLSCSSDRMFGTASSNLPVKEALACETPALRSDITSEDVIDGVSGYLIKPERTKEVAKKIAYLISHPSIAASMGKKGRQRIVKEYTWERVVNIIQTVISH